MVDFIKLRRQQFVAEKYADFAIDFIDSNNSESLSLLRSLPMEKEDISLLLSGVANTSYESLSIRYTAGQAIELLRDQLEPVIEVYEKYTVAKRDYEQSEQYSPLSFYEKDEYERLLQLIGLCYLLHRRDLLPRIAAMADPNYYGHDALYEELLDYELPDRYDTDKIFHIKPYVHLINAMYADSNEDSIAAIKQYCLDWYPAMAEAPWHNSHLNMTETDGAYFGYWAFEAGALAYLLELDDSTIDHMVYPKDLVAFAREFEAEPEKFNRARCPAKEACPQAGYWFTPAKPNSRTHFKQGDVMPDFPDSNYGATIWYWDQNQN